MATGALDANGIWQYGEDDSEATFSVLLNKLASSVSTQTGNRKILQVVNGRSTGRVANNTTTYVSTNLSATITPKSATSKIMVMVTHHISLYNAGGNNYGMGIRLLRNGTIIWDSIGMNSPWTMYYTTGSNAFAYSIDYLDAPATTSALTYSTVFASNGPNWAMNSNANDNALPSSITLFEVAA